MSSKITRKAVLFSADNQFDFTGDDYRPDKGEKSMELYKEYPAHVVLLRRTLAVVAGVLALPVMLFWKDRARFYSYLRFLLIYSIVRENRQQKCGGFFIRYAGWRRCLIRPTE